MPLIDTHREIINLTGAGFSPEQAEKVTDLINKLEENKGLATKVDIAEIKVTQKILIAVTVGTLLLVVGLYVK